MQRQIEDSNKLIQSNTENEGRLDSFDGVLKSVNDDIKAMNQRLEDASPGAHSSLGYRMAQIKATILIVVNLLARKMVTLVMKTMTSRDSHSGRVNLCMQMLQLMVQSSTRKINQAIKSLRQEADYTTNLHRIETVSNSW